MSTKKEMREIDVTYCDFCNNESTHVEKCSICGKEGCLGRGGAAHFAFSGELYRYKDGERSCRVRICIECAKLPLPNITVYAFASDLM